MVARREKTMRITQIYTYPIKSIRGTSLDAWTATYTGFKHDRRFMLQRLDKEENGEAKNMHVSGYPEMCLFTTSLSSSSHSDSTSGADIDTVEVRYGLSHTFDQPEQTLQTDSHDEESHELLCIPLAPAAELLQEKAIVQVVMHGSPTPAHDMGAPYNAWFSRRFGYAVRLLYLGAHRRQVLGNMPPDIVAMQREGTMGCSLKPEEIKGRRNQQAGGTAPIANSTTTNGSWLGSLTASATSLLPFGFGMTTKSSAKKEYDGVNNGISFADCAPYLVISTKSWEAAAARLLPPPSDSGTDQEEQKQKTEKPKLDISKFRPNIIVEGADEAWEEDYWGDLSILSSSTITTTTHDSIDDDNGEKEEEKTKEKARIILTQNCARCNSLNVDYSTGKVGQDESGKVLKKLQSDRRIDAGAKWSPIFGRYGFLARLRSQTTAAAEAEHGETGDRERVAEEEEVEIKVGDLVRVVRWNDERMTFEWPHLSTTS